MMKKIIQVFAIVSFFNMPLMAMEKDPNEKSALIGRSDKMGIKGKKKNTPVVLQPISPQEEVPNYNTITRPKKTARDSWRSWIGMGTLMTVGLASIIFSGQACVCSYKGKDFSQYPWCAETMPELLAGSAAGGVITAPLVCLGIWLLGKYCP